MLVDQNSFSVLPSLTHLMEGAEEYRSKRIFLRVQLECGEVALAPACTNYNKCLSFAHRHCECSRE